MDLVSIICPVYNVESELDRCLHSILNQTYINFELILVDDGSTDRSAKICDEYSKNDERIKVVHIDNNGAANARNVGLDICNGDFIAFVDSDDVVESRWLEFLVENIGTTELSVVSYFIEKQSDCLQIDASNSNIEIVKRQQCFHEIFDGRITTFLWNKLFKKNIIDKSQIRFNLETYWGEDALFVAQYCSCINEATICTKKLYHYIQRDGSIVNSGFNKKMLGFLHGYATISELAKEFDEENTVDITICVHCQSLLYRWYFSKNKDKEIGKLLKREIKTRRKALLTSKGRLLQRVLCLSMSVSISITCFALLAYKTFK